MATGLRDQNIEMVRMRLNNKQGTFLFEMQDLTRSTTSLKSLLGWRNLFAQILMDSILWC